MIAVCDAGHGRARFALAAGTQQHDIGPLHVREVLLVVVLEVLRQVAGIDGDLDDAVERAAGYDQLAPGGCGGVRDGFHAADVGGECRDGDAVFLRLDDVGEGGCDFVFGGGDAIAHGVCGIADEREDAFIAEGLEFGLVGRFADDRGGIDLPVGCVEDRARGCSDRKARNLRDRVRHVDQFDVEGAYVEPSAKADGIDLRLHAPAELGHLGFEHPHRERRAVDGRSELFPTIEHGADVVFVGMRDNDPGQSAAFLGDEAKVRQDDIDAWFVFLREGQA